MSVEELENAARQLSDEDRGRLVARLLDSFRPPTPVSDEEVLRRVEEGTADSTVMITRDELARGAGRG